MRLAVATLLAVASQFLASLPTMAAGPSVGAARLVAAVVTDAAQIEPVCRGCGCRGGAGWRLPSGKCAPRGR